MTVQGWTPLHLCSIWKAQKCFKVLLFYGGLNLNCQDKNKNTPLQCVIKSKCNYIYDCLNQYKSMKITFTKVEGERLTSGDVISLKGSNNSSKNIQIKQNVKKVPEQQKKLKEVKSFLEYTINQLKQDQIQSQFKNPQHTKGKNQKAQTKYNQQKTGKINNQNLNYQAKIKQKEQQLKKLQMQIKEMKQRRAIQQKNQAQRLAQKYVVQQQNKLKQLTKNQEQTIEKIKKKEVPVSVKEEKVNKPIQKQMNKNFKGSIQQCFKAINQKVPEQILQLYKKAQKKGKFIDQEFPADLSSIGDQSSENFQYFKDSIIWLRPSQIFGGEDYQLFDGIDPNDIQQGELGVCYMLATISSLAVKPSNIQRLFVFSDLKLGFFVLKLYNHAVPTFFVIDDLIPCDKNTQYPVFTQPVGNQLWVMLIQKCWAKAIGSYLSAEEMVPDEMMEDLSGAPGFGGWFQGQQTKLSIAQHIRIIQKHSNLGHTIVVTSGDKKIQGIVNSHVYTLMKVFKVNGKYIFKIRNPWGNFEWQGQYSQKSRMLTPQVKKAIGYTSEDDGIFFISQSQLVRAFEYYSISIVMDTHQYSYTQFTSQSNEDLFYKFTLKNPSYTNVRVSQPFNRMLGDAEYQYSPVKFQVGKIEKNGRVKFIGEGDEDSYYGAKSVSFTDNVCELLQAGDYFIRVNVQWVDEENYNSGVLSVYALQKVQIKPLDQQIGIQLMKSLFYSHSQQTPKQPTDDGFGFYRIHTMKGQFVLVAQTDKAGNFQVEFELIPEQMEGVQLGIGQVQQLKIRLPVSKGKPAIGTVDIICTADGGNTGSVYVTMTKI